MKRILIIVAYDGTNYHGWQVQDNAKTIEGELNKAIYEATGEKVEVSGASRTDAGVHSLGNLAVFDTDSSIPSDKWDKVLNQYLPEDIVVQRSEEVASDYHPRFNKYSKKYEYHILNRNVSLPTYERNAWFIYGKLDLDAMKKGAKYLCGEHDFAAFCGAGSQVKTTVRNITDIAITEMNLPFVTGYEELNGDATNIEEYDMNTGRMISISVTGDGFLYNMVRIIVGTLVEVGQGRRKPEDIIGVINSKDRSKAGKTAPAKGLMLMKIEY